MPLIGSGPARIVANLREVSRLINMEHAAATGNVVPREFPVFSAMPL